MLYQKEIDDSVLIQFIILFALLKADKPLAYNELLNVVLDNCNINYNDFQVALDNLVSTGHALTRLEGQHNQIYSLTQKGENAGDFFKTNIPIYIREPIEESIKQLFLEERRKNAVRAGITPVRRDEYAAECSLFDDDKTQLMGVTLYAGTREQAENIAEYFKANYDRIYEEILKCMTEKKTD